MAIFGKLTDVQKQFKEYNKLTPIFDYFDSAIKKGTSINKRIISMDSNQYKKVEITDDIFAIEQAYYTRNSKELLFESHVKYIDIQLILQGEEVIKVKHTDLLKIDSKYNDKDDYSLYKPCLDSSKILIQKNDLSIFFPNDGHMPGIQSGNVSQKVFKIVVKLPIGYL
jgi:biofilm protein TabA